MIELEEYKLCVMCFLANNKVCHYLDACNTPIAEITPEYLKLNNSIIDLLDFLHIHVKEKDELFQMLYNDTDRHMNLTGIIITIRSTHFRNIQRHTKITPEKQIQYIETCNTIDTMLSPLLPYCK